jgi:hypothetical protein
MAMTLLEAGTEVPALLHMPASEAGARPGALWRHAAGGALVRVEDMQVGCVNALVVPPQLADAVLAFLGIDPALVPLPGTVRDAVR